MFLMCVVFELLQELHYLVVAKESGVCVYAKILKNQCNCRINVVTSVEPLTNKNNVELTFPFLKELFAI